MKTVEAYIKTPLGTARILGSSQGIEILEIRDKDHPVSDAIPSELINCAEQLNAYFLGSRKSFDLKLNPKGTAFQKKVWQALQNIPFGKTQTYLELSKTLGDAKAIRAVANANSKNPLWIVNPCHRVIGSDGSLTGYAGGLWRKQWLLNHESPNKQQSLFDPAN